MDTWKGEKLYGADRRMTRAQLEAADRVPTRRCSLTRATGRLARSVGELYAETRERGPEWRAAVLMLSRLVAG
jgi:hypothetical protein